MALRAYVLIQAEPGKSRDVAKQMQKINGVKLVSVVTGPHDVIAYIEMTDAGALGDLLIAKVQKIKGITDTMTDVVID